MVNSLDLTCFFVSTEFKYGKAPILIATDVASRGLGLLFLLNMSFNISYCVFYEVLPFPFNCCAFLSPSHLKVESWRQDLGMTRPGSPGGGKELLCGVLPVCQPIKLHSEVVGAP